MKPVLVGRAMALPAVEPLRWQALAASRWAWAPHPSGRYRWYNDPANGEAAGRELARLLRGEP